MFPNSVQALVYDILPSTTAVFSYAIAGSRTELSANEQFFVGAQTVVISLSVQTTQIKQGVSL